MNVNWIIAQASVNVRWRNARRQRESKEDWVPVVHIPSSRMFLRKRHTRGRKMAELWKCMICAFVCLYLSDLLTHLNSQHREDSDFFRTCGLPDCSSEKEYTSANSLVKHVRSKHRNLLPCTWEDVFPVTHDQGSKDYSAI